MYPVAVAKVAEALGGERALGGPVGDLGELAAAVARGFPRGVIREIAASAAPARGEARHRIAALVVSPAT